MSVEIEHRCGHKKSYETNAGQAIGLAEFYPSCRCNKCIKTEKRGRVLHMITGPWQV